MVEQNLQPSLIHHLQREQQPQRLLWSYPLPFPCPAVLAPGLLAAAWSSAGHGAPSAHPQQGVGTEGWELAESSWDKNSGRILMWDKLCDVSSGCSSHPLLLQYALMLPGHCGAEPHVQHRNKGEGGFCQWALLLPLTLM